jgi:hypothetical protein
VLFFIDSQSAHDIIIHFSTPHDDEDEIVRNYKVVTLMAELKKGAHNITKSHLYSFTTRSPFSNLGAPIFEDIGSGFKGERGGKGEEIMSGLKLVRVLYNKGNEKRSKSEKKGEEFSLEWAFYGAEGDNGRSHS